MLRTWTFCHRNSCLIDDLEDEKCNQKLVEEHTNQNVVIKQNWKYKINIKMKSVYFFLKLLFKEFGKPLAADFISSHTLWNLYGIVCWNYKMFPSNPMYKLAIIYWKVCTNQIIHTMQKLSFINSNTYV